MIKKFVMLVLFFFDFIYQKKIIKFLKKKNINNLNIVLDVGAHKGESINLFLGNMTIKKIISFEASPFNFKFLEKNKKYYLKKFPNTQIVIENIALGSEKKETTLNQFDESSSTTINNINEESKYFKKKFNLLNYGNKKKAYESFKIKIETLGDYMEHNNLGNISFLKIDTEGYEYKILKGLKQKIKLIDTIMFEHHYDNMIIKGYTFTDINSFLKKNNFRQIYKSKMPFRKTFEYIYQKSKI